ncbi:MAG TPA: transcriptional regulator [Treponema sp.]|nr:transcriptional regulator [Treponema sp.]
MELRVLKYFLVIAEEENITRAASMVHITQPSLSRQIKQLEEECGVQLFTRGSKRMTLTPEGQLLKSRAGEIIELEEKTKADLRRADAEIKGTVSVGCGVFESVKKMADVFGAFNRKYPHVVFDIYTSTADDVRERMDRGLLDAGLLLEPVDMDKYEYIRMNVKERWVVMMRADSPLAEKEALRTYDLADIPIILPQRHKIQSELASWFGIGFEKLHIRYLSNLSENASILVEKGLGVSLTIEGSIPFLDTKIFCVRPLLPELPASSVFAWKHEQMFNPAAQKFISFAREALSGS